MSDAADRFRYPPDDPADIADTRGTFGRAAADTDRVAGKLTGDLVALRHGWGGDAANACGREVTANHRLVGAAARALADTDAAIGPYARAVTDARGEVDAVRARYTTGLADHEAHLRSIEQSPRTPDQRSTDRSAEVADWRGRVVQLEQDHRTALDAVTRAARVCRADLERIGERLGPFRPDQPNIVTAVSLTVDRRLPFQLATRDAARAADVLRRAAAGDKAAVRELALYDGLATDPVFATAVAEHLGPDGMLTLPASMVAAPTDKRSNAAVLRFASSVLATRPTGATGVSPRSSAPPRRSRPTPPAS